MRKLSNYKLHKRNGKNLFRKSSNSFDKRNELGVGGSHKIYNINLLLKIIKNSFFSIK